MSRPSSFFRPNRRATPESTTLAASPSRTTSLSGGTGLEPRAAGVGPNMQRSASTSRGGTPTMRGMERLEKRRTMEERNFLISKARAQNFNPPVDLRLLDYIGDCDDNLTCPICRCPFVDPVVLADCDHYFCRDCIRQTWNASTAYNPLGPRGDCPTCRTPAKLNARSATSKILINIVDDLLVRCPKAEEGCKLEIKRGEVQDHVSIYCGFALIECPDYNCELPVRRKDSKDGCLHYPVSCIACREEMQKCYLEKHWKTSCPDRKVACELCKIRVYYRDLGEHKTRQCSANVIPCPGHALGCNNRSMKSQAERHTRSCAFAKMAPLFTAMTERMDEQEAAQKEMSRKLEVLENGFTSMHSILYTRIDDPDRTSADPSSIPLLQDHNRRSPAPTDDVASPMEEAELGFARLTHADVAPGISPRSARHTTSRQTPDVPGPRPADSSEPFSPDFDLASPFPPPATNGPYASPLHHLLSMHESLRDEMSRVSAALQEVDGRHQMQTLNENLRTREEISYLTAQVAGLSRQVHWLTSAQLQRQGRSGTAGAGASGEAGPSVGAALSSAVQGAARMVSGAGREGTPPMPVRRGTSEEGRTKL